MLPPHVAWPTLGLAAAADAPSPTSPTAQIITAVGGMVVGIVVAITGLVQVRRRRAAEAEAAPAAVVDLEDRPSRIRERLSALEVRTRRLEHDVEDLREQQMLHRAVDVATEADASPRRRRQEKR